MGPLRDRLGTSLSLQCGLLVCGWLWYHACDDIMFVSNTATPCHHVLLSGFLVQHPNQLVLLAPVVLLLAKIGPPLANPGSRLELTTRLWAARRVQVFLRAERNGAGKGRLYRIEYTAAAQVGSCSGVAYVCVPHDASAFNPPTPEEAAALKAAAAAGGDAAQQKASGTVLGAPARKETCPSPGSIEDALWMPTQQA
jgi:hypothetical protein